VVKVDFVEEVLVFLAVALGGDVLETFVESELELVEVHDPILAPGIDPIPMQSLYGQFPEVLLHRKVNLKP